MTDLTANVRLRPTRIGYLVSPSDRKSIRKIMRINACLWGGVYNPIIPIFRNTPKEWREERFHNMSGRDVAEGYIKFFEPDVYVEAKDGLLNKAGLGSLRKDRYDSSVISLENFSITNIEVFMSQNLGSPLSILLTIHTSQRDDLSSEKTFLRYILKLLMTFFQKYVSASTLITIKLTISSLPTKMYTDLILKHLLLKRG